MGKLWTHCWFLVAATLLATVAAAAGVQSGRGDASSFGLPRSGKVLKATLSLPDLLGEVTILVRDGGLITIRNETSNTLYGLAPVFSETESAVKTLPLAIDEVDRARNLQAVRQVAEPFNLEVDSAERPRLVQLPETDGWYIAYTAVIQTDREDFRSLRRTDAGINLGEMQDYAASGADTCCANQSRYTVCATAVEIRNPDDRESLIGQPQISATCASKAFMRLATSLLAPTPSLQDP